jgi:hypothetical protein
MMDASEEMSSFPCVGLLLNLFILQTFQLLSVLSFCFSVLGFYRVPWNEEENLRG